MVNPEITIKTSNHGAVKSINMLKIIARAPATLIGNAFKIA
jgi:hypothetical protein